MARVRNIEPAELSADLAEIYREFAGSYGPFKNQVAVFAHVPAALRHLMPLLIELRAAKTLPKRALELAIVTVSQLNACDYCVAHHKPFLAVEPSRILDALFARLREHFSEAQIVELTLRITLCGFFNKFNDALQIEEEPEAVERLSAVAG